MNHVVLHLVSGVIFCLCWGTKVKSLLKTVRPHTETINQKDLSFDLQQCRYTRFLSFWEKKKRQGEILRRWGLIFFPHSWSCNILSWYQNTEWNGNTPELWHHGSGEAWIHTASMSSARQHCDGSEPKSCFPRLEGTARAGHAGEWVTPCWHLRSFVVLPTLL